MTGARPSIPTQLAAVLGSLVLGSGGFIPFGLGPIWAQAPGGQGGVPYASGPTGLMPLNPNSPNNPSNINPSMGSPVAPTQPQRPASWPGGSDSDPVPAPTRKAFAQPFGAAGPKSGQPGQVADSAATQPAASLMEL